MWKLLANGNNRGREGAAAPKRWRERRGGRLEKPLQFAHLAKDALHVIDVGQQVNL